MRRTTVEVCCEVHPERPGAQYIFNLTWHRIEDETYDGLRRTLELCDECFQSLALPLLTLLDQRGRPLANGREPKQERHDCPVEGCGKRYKGRTALASHVERVHGARLSEIRPDGALGCPDCPATFNGLKALGSHRNKAHGWVSPRRETDGKVRKR